MKITTEAWFCAAHRLPTHSGKCKQLHGHNYKVTVSVEGDIDALTGMVVDFADLKQSLQTVCDLLDHKLLLWQRDIFYDTLRELLPCGLYVFPCPPTCEVLAKHIHDTFEQDVFSVTVEETPGCSATYYGG